MVIEGRRILWVAGGREYDSAGGMALALSDVGDEFDVVVTGAAPGADLLGERIWRRDFQRPYIGIPAEWRKYGKPAGYRRNEVIAQLEPAALLALPGGKGTQHARDLAREYGIPIV